MTSSGANLFTNFFIVLLLWFHWLLVFGKITLLVTLRMNLVLDGNLIFYFSYQNVPPQPQTHTL